MKNFVALSLCILMPWTTFAAEGGTTTPKEIGSDPKPAPATTPQEPAKPAAAAKPAEAKPQARETVTKDEFLKRAKLSKKAEVQAALKKYEAIADSKTAEKKAAFDALKKAMGARTVPPPATAAATPAPKAKVTPTAGAATAPPVVQGPPPGADAPVRQRPETVVSGKDGKDGVEGQADCPTCRQPDPPPPVPHREARVIRETSEAITESSGGSVGGLGIGSRELMFGLGGALLGGIAGYMFGSRNQNNNGYGFGLNQQGFGFNPYAPRFALPGAYPAPGGFGLGGGFGGYPFGGRLPNAYPAPGGAAYGAGTQFGFGYGGGIYGQQPITGIGGGLYGSPNYGGYYPTPAIGNPTIGAGGAPIALPYPGPSAGGGFMPYNGVNGGVIYNGAR